MAEHRRRGNVPGFSEDDFAKAATSLSKDAFVRSLIVEYWKLEEENKKLFREFVCRLADGMKEFDGAADLPNRELTVEEAEAEYIKSRLNAARNADASALNITDGAEKRSEAG